MLVYSQIFKNKYFLYSFGFHYTIDYLALDSICLGSSRAKMLPLREVRARPWENWRVVEVALMIS